MCAILGVSFAPGSEINRHKLATALLSAGEVRGRDASGFAWVSPNGDGVYKKNIPGSKLHVGKLPTDATAMILHTRAATHGSPKDNDNNHPVLSPSGDIRLVHNGVINNHLEMRELLGKAGKNLPDVDSSVIPAIIEEFGIDATSELAGYASAAWFDRETDDTIHLARFKTSTVFFATLWDGSLAFASTADILGKALMKANVAWMGSYPSPFESMNEGEYYQIMGGEIVTESEVEWKTGYTYHGADYSAQTSGGKSTSGPEGYGYVTPYSAPSHTGAGFSKATGSEDKPMALAPAASLADDDEDVVNAELLPFPNEAVAQAVISNLFSNDGEEMTEEQYEAFITGSGIGDPEFDDPDMPDMEEYLSGSRSSFQPMFFTYEHDGSFSSYITLKGLLAALSWNAHLTTGENLLVGPEEGDVRWVNHFMDIGALSEDGSQEFSWVKHEEDYVMWEGITPTFVRDGITKLRTLVGA